MKYWGDKINENEMGRAYSTHEGDGKCVQIFCRKARREENLEDMSIHWRIILKLI
jgi:hypothetical protein